MSANILQDDLWGELPSANNTPMPVAFLRQQSRFLTDKSGGVLEHRFHGKTF